MQSRWKGRAQLVLHLCTPVQKGRVGQKVSNFKIVQHHCSTFFCKRRLTFFALPLCKHCLRHTCMITYVMSENEHSWLQYIYIYAFSWRFYPKRLTVLSGYICFSFFHQYVCSLGIEPTTFCAANAMLYHWATGTQYIYTHSIYYCILKPHFGPSTRALHGPNISALARPVSDSSLDLPARVRPEAVFFIPSPETAYTTVSAIEIVQFCMKWQSDCILFHYFMKLIYKNWSIFYSLNASFCFFKVTTKQPAADSELIIAYVWSIYLSQIIKW